jgi:hypothetical protein
MSRICFCDFSGSEKASAQPQQAALPDHDYPKQCRFSWFLVLFWEHAV